LQAENSGAERCAAPLASCFCYNTEPVFPCCAAQQQTTRQVILGLYCTEHNTNQPVYAHRAVRKVQQPYSQPPPNRTWFSALCSRHFPSLQLLLHFSPHRQAAAVSTRPLLLVLLWQPTHSQQPQRRPPPTCLRPVAAAAAADTAVTVTAATAEAAHRQPTRRSRPPLSLPPASRRC
jgi:hypothetical protein